MKVNKVLPVAVIAAVCVAGGVYLSQDSLTGALLSDMVPIPQSTIDLIPCDVVDTEYVNIDCTTDGSTLKDEGDKHEAHEGNKPNDGGGGNTVSSIRG